MNANSAPGHVGTTQLTTFALFDDLRDRKSLDLREIGRGGGDRTHDLRLKSMRLRFSVAQNQQLTIGVIRVIRANSGRSERFRYDLCTKGMDIRPAQN
jgi:hypothetical protein